MPQLYNFRLTFTREDELSVLHTYAEVITLRKKVRPYSVYMLVQQARLAR